METTGAAQGAARDRFIVTEAERQVADLLPIEVDPALARATVESGALLVPHLRAQPR